MIEQEYIMLIMNCKKYLKKAKFQKMTWLPKIPSYLQYYHVIILLLFLVTLIKFLLDCNLFKQLLLFREILC